MFEDIKKYREKIETFFKPHIWWSFWLAGVLYFSYELLFNGIAFLKYNYALPAQIAVTDAYAGRLFLLAIHIPLTFFASLFTGHVTLALYKINKLKKT